MGQGLSQPECNVPLRSFIGLDNARMVALNCARHRQAYLWGLVSAAVIALVVGFILTRDPKPGAFFVPLWTISIPILFGLVWTLHIYRTVQNTLQTEFIEFQLSGMSKKDYMNYKIGDDRTNKSFGATATSAAVLTGSNILGPFLRGDK